MIDLTPEDHARLWPDTRPVLDVAIDNGGARQVTWGETDCVLKGAVDWCSPYEEQSTNPENAFGSPFGVNAADYALWTSSVTPGAKLTIEMIRKAAHELKWRGFCEFWDIEEWDMKQRFVPVALHPGTHAWTTRFEWRSREFGRLVLGVDPHGLMIDDYRSISAGTSPPYRRLRGLDAAFASRDSGTNNGSFAVQGRPPERFTQRRLDGRRR